MKNTRIHLPRPNYERLIKKFTSLASLDYTRSNSYYDRKYKTYKRKYLQLKNKINKLK